MTRRIAIEPAGGGSGAGHPAARLARHLAGERGVEVLTAPNDPGADLVVVVSPDGLADAGSGAIAWVDTASARSDDRWTSARPARWATTSATAAAVLRRRRPDIRPVVAEPPGAPCTRPLDAPDPAARRYVVVPADDLDHDRMALVLAAYAGVPGDQPLLLLDADVSAADHRVRCIAHPSAAERARLLREAVVTVLAGPDQLEPTAALEAFGLGSGVVCCTDGGAVRELVRDRVTGRVVVPERAALAEVLHVQVGIPTEPVRHGARGRVVWESLTWGRCLRRLLGARWRVADAVAVA